MARTPFRTVWHLWIEPDFSRVESGELAPPYVDQARLDYARLQDLLKDTFAYERANLRVPNDFIDLLTARSRIGVKGLDMRFQDLAKRLRLEARKQSEPVIDVGKIWSNRLSMASRRIVPPPRILPMVIETVDYEEMIHLRLHQLMRLGVIKEHPMDTVLSAATGEKSMEALDEKKSPVGKLPESLREAFKDMFGIDYLPKVMLDTASTDPLPAWAKRLG